MGLRRGGGEATKILGKEELKEEEEGGENRTARQLVLALLPFCPPPMAALFAVVLLGLMVSSSDAMDANSLARAKIKEKLGEKAAACRFGPPPPPT